MKHLIALIAFAALIPQSAAQQKPALPNPVAPAAPVPQAKYESAFSGYNAYREQDLAGWREVNDEVAHIGGHTKIFGGTGHAEHSGTRPEPVRPAPGEPAASKHQPASEPPARGAPQTPQGGRKGY